MIYLFVAPNLEARPQILAAGRTPDEATNFAILDAEKLESVIQEVFADPDIETTLDVSTRIRENGRIIPLNVENAAVEKLLLDFFQRHLTLEPDISFGPDTETETETEDTSNGNEENQSE